MMLPDLYRIQRLKMETDDTFTLEMIPENGDSLSFLPGQFNMLYIFGVGEVPISISSDPSCQPRHSTHDTRCRHRDQGNGRPETRRCTWYPWPIWIPLAGRGCERS